MRKSSSLKRCLLLAASVFVVDQISKIWVLLHVQSQTMAVAPHFNFVLGYNKGAAFGILATAAGWQRWFFIGVVIAISLILILWSKRLGTRDRLENFALGLILGGAWGNVCDRIRLGYVVDFIDFYVGNWHWYTFNIADSAICIGAFILAYVSLKKF